MASWQQAAVGTSLWDLEATIADLNLQKGDRMRVEMDLKVPVGFLFDAAGAELLFKPVVPDGMDLVDVWGEGSKAYVELEADPVFLVAALAFIKAHWVGIVIAGFLLAALVASIIVFIKIEVYS